MNRSGLDASWQACLASGRPPAKIFSHLFAHRRDKQRGFQLYQSDPSGNYGGWKATAIGANHQAATNVLQGDYKDELSLEEVRGGVAYVWRVVVVMGPPLRRCTSWMFVATCNPRNQ